jgi:hypothetical protein
MSKEYPLDGLALEIRAHWKKHRPEMYLQLEHEGKLDLALHEASERPGEAFAEMVKAGTEPLQELFSPESDPAECDTTEDPE